jgi:hypothetical protein
MHGSIINRWSLQAVTLHYLSGAGVIQYGIPWRNPKEVAIPNKYGQGTP